MSSNAKAVVCSEAAIKVSAFSSKFAIIPVNRDAAVRPPVWGRPTRDVDQI